MKRNPGVQGLAQLREFIDKCGGAVSFFRRELDYWDEDRARTLDGVLNWMLGEITQYAGASEGAQIGGWAKAARPEGYKTMLDIPGYAGTNVPGFGLSGWQYLRMLFGADTCKPDRHIRDFIKCCLKLNKRPGGLIAIRLMHAAAPLAGLTVREADRRIWWYMRGKAERERGGCY